MRILIPLFALLAVVCPSLGHAQSRTADASGLRLPRSAQATPRSNSHALLTGEIPVALKLTDPPLGVANGANTLRIGGRLTPAQQRAYVAQLNQKQSALMSQVAALGGRELGRVTKAHNALLVSIAASRLQTLKTLPGVTAVRRIADLRQSLSETVPYIGAAAAHAAGVTGAGVTIAILDSGIDYTHRNLGGQGTIPAYQAAYGVNTTDTRNKTRDGLFPTAKVIGGVDFVGEAWPNGPLSPDLDPIDAEGHGTHVADIAAGQNGVAPDAKLLAVKVCSAVSTSCNGIASLLGVDYALDPDGNGDITDAVHVINLSLGGGYGQREDDLSEACANAVRLGVVVVAAVGNDADRPYIAGSPATTPEVISVANTYVPSAISYDLIVNSPPSIAGAYKNTATVAWAPIGSGFVARDVAYVGRGCPAGSVEGQAGADPYLANPAGKVALIDRGACDISLKVDRAADAGAVGVLIANNVPGDAPSFSLGGGDDFVPTLVITQSTGQLLKDNLPVNVTVSPAYTTPLSGSVISSSSRGPSYSYHAIKPDIAAPGDSVSAVVGTGTGEEAFSGTSGAAPMVTGSAALLIQAYPTLPPRDIKARLMNTAEINIFNNAATEPGVLAPITRIGAGEVRVNRARLASGAAWDAGNPAAVSLSFGAYRVAAGQFRYQKKVQVRNYSASARTYNIQTSFRYAADASSGAVTLSAPSSVTVPANGNATFILNAVLDPNLLPAWTLNGGSRGGDGFRLQGVEYDGYLTLDAGGGEVLRLPWHLLPHKAANVTGAPPSLALVNGVGSFNLNNVGGAVEGPVDVFSLTGTSPQIPASALPAVGENFAVVDLRAVGVRLVGIGGGEYGVQFAINTWGQRAHPNYPAEFDIVIDVNRDGVDDYLIYNGESGGFVASGQNVVNVLDLSDPNAEPQAFFYTIADLDSANVILTAPLFALGMTPSSRFTFSVLTGDNYFTGLLTDLLLDMTYQLDTPRFFAASPFYTVPVGGSTPVTVYSVPGGAAASPSQTGLLLLYQNGKSGREADIVQVGP